MDKGAKLQTPGKEAILKCIEMGTRTSLGFISPLKEVYKKQNRANQSGGDREARGIFEFGTTVGLRRYPVRVCTEPKPKSVGNQRTILFNARNSKTLTVGNKARLLMSVKEKNKILAELYELTRRVVHPLWRARGLGEWHGLGGKCHGLSRVVSRVAIQKRPVFIGLSRCHGSRPPGDRGSEGRGNLPIKLTRTNAPPLPIGRLGGFRLQLAQG